MRTSIPVAWFCSITVLVSCGAERASLPAPKRAPPLPPQAGYCERLQPLLDKTVRAARIGTEMSCLDVPGVTELGRYGTAQAGEEEALTNCFDQATQFDALLQSPEDSFQLSIEDGFMLENRSGVGFDLTRLVPWLPRFDVHNQEASRLTARVTIREARFVTLVGLATKLQGAEREDPCLQALCKPEYSYVHKALVGIPSVTLTATDLRGRDVALGPAFANVDFSERELRGGSRELISTKPVTLAIARSAFRTPQTERLCQFCGRKGQPCCGGAPACDGGLGCASNRCDEVGGPGQPCDGESCSGGATCVSGSCRMECGGRGQPCCLGSECSGKLRCAPDPENAIEHSVAAQELELDGGFFGTNEDQTFGVSSCGALRRRCRFAVTKLGSGRGNCDKAWWFDPKNERDCRVAAHFDVSTFGTIRCRIEIFATAPPKPDVCVF